MGISVSPIVMRTYNPARIQNPDPGVRIPATQVSGGTIKFAKFPGGAGTSMRGAVATGNFVRRGM